MQIVLVSILKPYLIFGYRFRPMLNLAVTLLIEVIYLLIPYSPLAGYALYAPFAVVGLLALCLSYNFYYFVKACCSAESD